MNPSRTSRRLTAPLALGALVIAITLGAPPAQAATEATNTTSKKKTSKSVKIKNSQNNSAETPAERDRRLYRECKGLPNAGACRGYTQR